MGVYNYSPSLVATTAINPSVFVTLDSANSFQMVQATANSKIFGISQAGTNYAPNTGQNAYAYEAGEAGQVLGLGSVCLINLGSGGCTTGDFLESDTNGNAVTSTVSGHFVGAVALETGVSGQLVNVQVQIFNHA